MVDSGKLDLVAASLRHYREMHALSQGDAAAIAGVTKNAYARAEAGKTAPSGEWVLRLCRHYGIPMSRLFESLAVPEVAFHENRHETRRLQALQRETIRDAVRWAEDYRWLEKTLGEEPAGGLPDVRALSPKDAARKIRATFWAGGGFTPESFPSTLAAHGIKVYVRRFPDPETFGFSFSDPRCGWVIAVNGDPIVPAERKLWLAAHELGHILLGTAGKRYKKQEQEEGDANDFASELLMPEAAFAARWEDCAHLPYFERVIAVKRDFHVRADTVLYRVTKRLGADERERLMRSFNAEAKRRGMPNTRENEPRSLYFEFEGDRFKTLALCACRQRKISVSRLAELYGEPVLSVMKRLREMPRGDFRA